MKENELRIGNYVSVTPHNEYDILQINQSELGSLIMMNTWERINQIPLTEEWLLRFGYELWDEKIVVNEYESYKRYVNYNLLGTSNHEVHIITSTYGNTNHVEYATSIDKDQRQYNWRMDYVHDLQNATFKETGIELTLKN